MHLEDQLFTGQKIVLGPIDHEKDPEIESRWTHDSTYQALLDTRPALPMSAAQLKKHYEKLEKQMADEKRMFYFTIRAPQDERLLGFLQIYWIEWTNGTANLRLGIGDAQDRRQGYGEEALRLGLAYAFGELNLFRLNAVIAEYNQPALDLFHKLGFVDEVRRRQALQREGRRWDLLHLGLLRYEWEPSQHAQAATSQHLQVGTSEHQTGTSVPAAASGGAGMGTGLSFAAVPLFSV